MKQLKVMFLLCGRTVGSCSPRKKVIIEDEFPKVVLVTIDKAGR